MSREIAPDRWQQISQLYHAALARDADERSAFLRDACCGDEALRHEVESLLAREGAAKNLLSAPTVDAAAHLMAIEQTGTLVGRQIGVYRVLSRLGAGGMGEVYRARDTRLGRDVAIKVLPPMFTADGDRLARFEREARMLATLNHPHIGAIYGFESADGMCALVLELVDGVTLAERLASVRRVLSDPPRRNAGSKGPGLQVNEALGIARQIADALDAAHEKGIIHRDLKPANIKITPEGTVKVLDFGLAKAATGDRSGQDLSQSPTITVSGTHEGMILGTPAYMSPEQARGKPVDKRTDIWAFGCVLYEMLAGRVAFAGETMSDTIAAILEREPDWRAVPPQTPASIRRLLQRCLEKDLKRRLRDMGDVRIEVEDAAANAGTPAESGTADSRRASRRWRLAALTSITALIIVAGTLTTLLVLRMRAIAPSTPAPTARTIASQLTDYGGTETRTEILTPPTNDPVSFALSPDGQKLVFVAAGDGPSRLWLRPLAGTASQPLVGTEGASVPFWSPDSRSVGFFADGKLKRFDIGGGAPQTLATAVARGGTWNADGVILFARTTVTPLSRVSASGGDAVTVTTLDRQTYQGFPAFLPDGQHFLFYAVGRPEGTGIYLGSLDSGDTTRLTAADTAGVYTSSGWLLFVRAGTLVAQRLDLARRALAGDTVRVADSVAFDDNGSGVSASAAGLVAYRPGGASRRQLRWFDRAGKALGPFGAPDETRMSAPSVSPDGRRVAVDRVVQGNQDIWLLDATRTSRFTFETAPDRNPIWSPDGRRIVFDSIRKGVRDLYVKPSSGAGSEEPLVESPQDKVAQDWSADGRFILYRSADPQTGRDLWVLPLEGDRKPWVFLKTNFEENQGQFSPDGRWVAYKSNESGRPEIYVRPFVASAVSTARDGATATRAGGQWQVSTAGGIYPQWRPDGKELYYIGPDGQMMAAPIAVTGTALEPGAPVALFETRIYGGGADNAQGPQYDVTRDGRFLINTVLDEAASTITLIQNWKPK